MLQESPGSTISVMVLPDVSSVYDLLASGGPQTIPLNQMRVKLIPVWSNGARLCGDATWHNQTDGASMGHQASGQKNCQRLFSLSIEHRSYASKNPGVWGRAPVLQPGTNGALS